MIWIEGRLLFISIVLANPDRKRSHADTVQTLRKWSDKINSVAPSTLLPSSRNAFRQSGNSIKTIPELVDEALRDGRVFSRTRIANGGLSRLGESRGELSNEETQEMEEVFDDTDFYQQLLRDVIDQKQGADSTCFFLKKCS